MSIASEPTHTVLCYVDCLYTYSDTDSSYNHRGYITCNVQTLGDQPTVHEVIRGVYSARLSHMRIFRLIGIYHVTASPLFEVHIPVEGGGFLTKRRVLPYTIFNGRSKWGQCMNEESIKRALPGCDRFRDVRVNVRWDATALTLPPKEKTT